jgi:hypothetical protein
MMGGKAMKVYLAIFAAMAAAWWAGPLFLWAVGVMETMAAAIGY